MTLEEFKEYKNRPKCFYTKEETDAILKSISLKVVVEQLPEYGNEGYLYLVPSIADPNVYELFIWNNDTWESLGNVNKEEYLDYVTNPELDNAISEVKNLYEVTYAELRLLVQNSKLIPGALYRITDYVTTTTQADTQSAGHQFDIIVTALNTNTLSENASAIQHEGDTYFANSKLSAWKIWYCLDNDTTRFAWVDNSLDEDVEENIVYQNDTYYRYPSEDELDGFGYSVAHAWRNNDNNTIYTDVLDIPQHVITWNPDDKDWLIAGSISAYNPSHEGTGLPNGKGVIYRMIDEWGNDVCYDFKNILFKRKLTNGEYDPTNGTDTWVYTFTTFLLSGILYDNSLGIDLSLLGGSGVITFCAENIIKPCYNYEDQMSVLGGQGEIILNNNVFLSPNGDMILSFIYANKFDVNSNMNTFLGLAQENTFGSRCINNKFGLDCSGNNIGKRFTNNVIDNLCLNNIIGNDVLNCQFNYYTQDNIFGNDISNCIFGNPDGHMNNTDSGFYNSTIGNQCFYLSLIGDISNFTIGNGVRYFNTTAITTNSVIVESGVSYVTLDCPSSDDYEKICQNITIAQGVSGTNSAQKTITHPTVNDTFQTIYRPVNSLIISV